MNFNKRLEVILESKQLNVKFWDNNTLKTEIRNKLYIIIKDFMAEYYDGLEYKDVIFTGSLANYNWTNFSDIDIHIILEFDKICKDAELIKQYSRLAGAVWNANHSIEICGHEVEIYVQDINEEHFSGGVYSIVRNKWLTKPNINQSSSDSKQISIKTNKIISQIQRIASLLEQGKLDTETPIRNLKKKIKNMRRAGLKKNGEFSMENLVFKKLRNEGYLQQLSGLLRQAYDSRMSLNNCSNL